MDFEQSDVRTTYNPRSMHDDYRWFSGVFLLHFVSVLQLVRWASSNDVDNASVWIAGRAELRSLEGHHPPVRHLDPLPRGAGGHGERAALQVGRYGKRFHLCWVGKFGWTRVGKV